MESSSYYAMKGVWDGVTQLSTCI